jgi:hypothetical protein
MAAAFNLYLFLAARLMALTNKPPDRNMKFGMVIDGKPTYKFYMKFDKGIRVQVNS